MTLQADPPDVPYYVFSIKRGFTFSRTIGIWGNSEQTKPYDPTGANFQIQIDGRAPLLEGSNLTVISGKEKEGEHEAEPLILHVVLNEAETTAMTFQSNYVVVVKRTESWGVDTKPLMTGLFVPDTL